MMMQMILLLLALLRLTMYSNNVRKSELFLVLFFFSTAKHYVVGVSGACFLDFEHLTLNIDHVII